MSRRRPSLWAAGAGSVLVVSLWLPWFRDRLSTVFAPVRAERSVSGWRALGGAAGLGGLVLAVAALSVAWSMLGGRRPAGAVGPARRARPSAVWLVIAGALALMVDVAATVDRVGARSSGEVVTTTSPRLGLAVAFAAALGVLLTGLAVLVGESGERSEPG